MAYKNPLDPINVEKSRLAKRNHYHANKEKYLVRSREKKLELRQFVQALKETNPCSDCKLFYPYYVMQFDHLDAETKEGTISSLISYGNERRLKAEIEKCELVCANCHAARTYERSKVL